MNNLPIEIINHIMRFNSHPLADIARDNIISTRFGTYYYIGDKLRWMFSEESDFIDGYETYVIEQHIKNHYNIKYIRDIKMFDKLYYHINKNHIDVYIISLFLKRKNNLQKIINKTMTSLMMKRIFLLRYPHEVIGVYEN